MTSDVETQVQKCIKALDELYTDSDEIKYLSLSGDLNDADYDKTMHRAFKRAIKVLVECSEKVIGAGHGEVKYNSALPICHYLIPNAQSSHGEGYSLLHLALLENQSISILKK